MRTSFKAMLVAGTIAAVATAHAKEAKAEPLVSSWYGSELEGSPTASGEPYRPDGRTAAHRSLPLGTELLVSYGSQQTVVRVNDRGPHVAGRDLDLSRGQPRRSG
jgi:rare lipoprotein A